jgi:hypothetical protein
MTLEEVKGLALSQPGRRDHCFFHSLVMACKANSIPHG